MGQNRLLNVLETTEIILCIHRSYFSLSNVVKKVALLRVCLVIILYTIASLGLVSDCEYTEYPIMCMIFTVYTMSSTAFTLITIVNGIIHTRSYKVFIIKMDKIHRYCKDNVSYERSMTYLLILFFVLTAINYAPYVLVYPSVIWTALNQSTSNGIFLIFYSIIESSMNICRDSFLSMEFSIFIILVRIIITCLNVMKMNLITILKRLHDVEAGGIDDITYFELRRDLRKWAATYYCIAECCDDLKKFYGIQVGIFIFYNYLFNIKAIRFGIIA